MVEELLAVGSGGEEAGMVWVSPEHIGSIAVDKGK